MKVVVLVVFLYSPFGETIEDYQVFSMKEGYKTVEQCEEVGKSYLEFQKRNNKDNAAGYSCKEVTVQLPGEYI